MKVTKVWQSVNDVEGVEVGSLFKIKNNSINTIILKSSETLPTDETDSIALTGDKELVVSSFSKTVWARTNSASQTDLYVEDNNAFLFQDSGLDPRVYLGDKAITVQPFIEANVKNGTQFESTTYTPSFPKSPTTVSTVFITGDKDVLIKAQSLELNGSGVKIEVFKNPTYTVGVGVPNDIYNMSDSPTAEPTSVSILSNVTVSNFGTKVGADLYVLGSDTPASSDLVIGKVAGLERRLEKNTTYLRKVTSLSSVETQVVFTYTTWYEGPLSNEII